MSFDVFLSHNSMDKQAVRTLAAALKQRGLSVWLDECELRPGVTWQDALENILADCKSAIVCLGGSGIGPWEVPEMQALLRRFVDEKKSGNVVPIIPVLLPGAPASVKLPLFLEAFVWVDLRHGLTPSGLERLRWGITGEKPIEGAPTVCLAKVVPDLRKARETVASYLTSARINVLPVKPYASDPAKFLPALEADLALSQAFVQILGPNYTDRTDDVPEGEELAQFRRAENSGTIILQWRDQSVSLDAIDDAVHRDLVGGVNVVCNDLAEFARLVAERATRIYEVGRRPVADGHHWLALIRADKPDQVVAEEISETLSSVNVNCRVTRTGKSLVDTLREVPYDAVLIVYGSCADEWLERHGDELMAVDLNLKEQAPVRAYYLCAEEPRLPYRSKAVLQIKRRDEAGWQKLIAAIQKRGGRP